MSFKAFAFIFTFALASGEPRPSDMVDLRKIDPTIEVQLAYFSSNNFVGKQIDGYNANICYLDPAAAQALKLAQARLKKKNSGLTLLVYDCYRPQKAVAHFMRWVKEKQREELVKDGYIAPQSEHSRGYAVDVTIAAGTASGSFPLDMGGAYDHFSERSHAGFQGIEGTAKANRKMLAAIMAPEFAPYPQEWWHFSLKSKTPPRARMDFDVAP